MYLICSSMKEKRNIIVVYDTHRLTQFEEKRKLNNSIGLYIFYLHYDIDKMATIASLEKKPGRRLSARSFCAIDATLQMSHAFFAFSWIMGPLSTQKWYYTKIIFTCQVIIVAIQFSKLYSLIGCLCI